MTTSQGVVDPGSYQVDLELDFANEDQTGLIWSWPTLPATPSRSCPGQS